ncbi:uncharacterized protein LOC143468685 isoform X2 [Clavelina lepadiformis]|uniref:uncharacterized protein LOC143468685 isoform X2 n=1 Tax=Clavelina lepadiformis TaxID=159417 RepID=UPI0040434507
MKNETSAVKRKLSGENYHARYKHLKSTIKQLTFENAALTSEIHRTEEKAVTAKAERKYLLRKLLQFEKPECKVTKQNPKKKAVAQKTNIKEEVQSVVKVNGNLDAVEEDIVGQLAVEGSINEA